MKRKKVILDTNLWISFLITKNFEAIDHLVDKGYIVLIFSEESLEEFVTVARRPKISKYFPELAIDEILSLFHKYGKLVNVVSDITDCRDQKDNFLLNLAIDTNADYLVIGDSDLLILKQIKNTRVIKWNDFLKEMNKLF
jgi:putative PIN family toxin of toxin-antitoxin system